MGKIIFEFAVPFLILIYLIVDVLIPSFTGAKYFWFWKSFKSKPKQTFEQEVKDAEKAYKEAKTKMEDLKDSANEETEEAKERLAQAEKIYNSAKEKLEKLNKK